MVPPPLALRARRARGAVPVFPAITEIGVAQNAERITEAATNAAISAEQLDRSIRSISTITQQADEITHEVMHSPNK